MRNILLEISFNGKNYHGWQIQENAVTVQQTLRDALKKVLCLDGGITGCSRTDAGVHANMFCCNFKTPTPIPLENIPLAVNSQLPGDIVVKRAEEMPDDFNSRFDCKRKRYIYIVRNSPIRDPFRDGLCYCYPRRIDEKFLDEQAKSFVGEYDFNAFCASGCEVEDRVRRIYSFDVYRKNEDVVFSVTGNGFLYNMVRIMVGTLIDTGRGKIEKDSIGDIIKSRQRENAGITVPGEGLYLDKVFYSEVENEKESV